MDTSVWIDLFGEATSPASHLLESAMAARHRIWITDSILQEVLQGAGSEAHFRSLEQAMAHVPLVEDDPRAVARDAAALYARCRWKGITIRATSDCRIAASAMRHRLPLLTRDRDFVRIRTIAPSLILVEPGEVRGG